MSKPEWTSLLKDEPLTSEMREKQEWSSEEPGSNEQEVAGYNLKRAWTSGWSETIVDSSTTSTDAINLVQPFVFVFVCFATTGRHQKSCTCQGQGPAFDGLNALISCPKEIEEISKFKDFYPVIYYIKFKF